MDEWSDGGPVRPSGTADRLATASVEADARGHASPYGTGCGRRSCWTELAATPTPRSPAGGTSASTRVRKWRGRFAAECMNGPGDRQRCGRPSRFTAVQQAQIKALACELPATTGVPLSRWSSAELAEEAVIVGGWSRRSAPPPCSGGYIVTRSNPGSTGPGSRRRRPTSQRGPQRSWTYIPAASTATHSARTTTCSARTRRPPSSPAAAATPPCHPAGPGRYASNTIRAGRPLSNLAVRERLATHDTAPLPAAT